MNETQDTTSPLRESQSIMKEKEHRLHHVRSCQNFANMSIYV